MAKQNTAEYALLGLLTKQPASGYDLRRLAQETMGHFWNESFASIYPMLKRLHQKGWVSRTDVEQDDKPDKIVYEATSTGRAAFAEWLKEAVTPSPPRDLLMLKLYFGRQTDPEVLRGHIDAYRRRLMENLSMMEPQIAKIRNAGEDHPDHVFTLLTLSQNIHATRAMLAWCKSADEVLAGLGDQE